MNSADLDLFYHRYGGFFTYSKHIDRRNLDGVEAPTTVAHLFWVVHKSHGRKLLIA